jgi:hypothetical protein
MLRKLEYDFPVQKLNRATGAGFALVGFAVGFLALTLTTMAGAQINGMPASVTSPGFGGRPINGVAPSVTSLGPRGFAPGAPTCCFRGSIPGNLNRAPDHHHHHDRSLPWGGVYAVPYYGYYDSGNDVTDDSPGDQYDGGPTIFDRRGSGTAPPPVPAPYPSRVRNYGSDPAAAPDADRQPDDAAPAPDQPQTVLVFKDGHQIEVANYAIVGSMLYDLTGGRRQKIALADLDLAATEKQNEDRGIDFRVPGASEAN